MSKRFLRSSKKSSSKYDVDYDFFDDSDDDLDDGFDDNDANVDDDNNENNDDDIDFEEDSDESQSDDDDEEPRNQFIFNKQIIFQKLPNSQLTNDYQNPWTSIDGYIKTMFNLTVESFINPLRKHLKELKEHRLDPRDLYLYKDVHIHPTYDYYIRKKSKFPDEPDILVPYRSNEHDLFIQFTVRFPTLQDKKQSKLFDIKKINWEHTERLRKRSLLLFSTSPYMETIEAVAYSCAKKGTIEDCIVPIKILQGNLDTLKSYFMFEPVGQWNEAIADNLLNTNENTIPQPFIKPFLLLDFSENEIEYDKNLFKLLKDPSFNEIITVDNEQLDALKFSLDHHLTLVNGAPGTGKTHLGCEVVKYLIKSNYDSPILVVTYKNVSLDNFLDKISDFLQENNIDFIRIGGKPRTKNNFILEHDFKQGFPNRKLKRELLYVISLLIAIDDCLNEMDDDENGQKIYKLIDEIEKIVSLRKKLFDKFPFFDKQEELLISNFFEPYQHIPPAYVYFTSYIYGNAYFEESRANCQESLMNFCNLLLGQINRYYNKKVSGEDDNENNFQVDQIIEKHFGNDENRFYNFLSMNKNKLRERNINLLFDIIQESTFPGKMKRLKNLLIENAIEFWDKSIISQISNEFDSLFSTKFDMEAFQILIEKIQPLLLSRKKRLEKLIRKRAIAYQRDKTVDLGERLSKMKLIAMTATRAAQFKESLDLSNCKFMIFEEAGELTEPITFSVIPKTVQQMMMIGDYNQLRPTVEYELTKKPFFFDISLFEKEVIHSKKTKANNLFTLAIQRRMHPQIASMLRRAFYDNNRGQEKLIDADCTKSLEKPIGFPTHLQFWIHNFPEESEQQIRRSHINIQEAKFCAFLFLMMLCRGYKSTEITIISLYKGQKKQIEKEIALLMDKYYTNSKTENFDAFDFENDIDESKFSEEQQERLKNIDKKNDFKKIIDFRKTLIGRFVKCLDDFQGEENEVIIVSLTRSEKPGFLSSRNRSLVTLSRAKQIQFVLGNEFVFGPSSTICPLWSSIASQFTDQFTLSEEGITVCGCPIHGSPNQVFTLNKLGSFIECRFNCCRKSCQDYNSCGHSCELSCHLHKEIKRNHPEKFKLFERRNYCSQEKQIMCKNYHQYTEKCGFCTHFGVPPCPFKCESKCAQCSRRCVMNCSHQGKCQCGHLENYLNQVGKRLICDECYKKNETIRKKQSKK